MNTEQFHDALTLLPEDLVAEVDALRRPQKQKVIYWKRILPTAACAAIVLLSALTLPDLLSPKGSLECADEAAPAEAAVQAPAAAPQMEKELLESPAEALPDRGQGSDRSMVMDEAAIYPLTARYLPVHPSDTEGGQQITVISSREELETYLAESDPGAPLAAACEGYDEAYFADRQLVLLLTAKYRSAASYSGNVLLPMESGSWSAEKTGDSSWTLRVQDMIHDDSARDVVRQHILLEIPGQLISETDTIILTQEP